MEVGLKFTSIKDRTFVKRRFGLQIIDDERGIPFGVLCVRKNNNLVGKDGHFTGYYSYMKYQMWAKHLMNPKTDTCRRCGITGARRLELKKEGASRNG